MRRRRCSSRLLRSRGSDLSAPEHLQPFMARSADGLPCSPRTCEARCFGRTPGFFTVIDASALQSTAEEVAAEAESAGLRLNRLAPEYVGPSRIRCFYVCQVLILGCWRRR